MAQSDDYSGGQPSPAALYRLQEYVVRTAKAVLCIACWAGVFAFLVTYGPATMRVSFHPLPRHPYEIVTGVLGVVLSGGVAVLLTIVMVILVVVGLDWHQNRSQTRNRRSDDRTGSAPDPGPGPDAREAVEEEFHA